jgi:starvation-inducible DNA-binding protein
MLSDSLKTLLASTQSFAIKSQNFHWNIEGSNFPQYHSFYDTLYGDVDGTIDRIAEYIRILGHYTPGSLQRYAELTIIEDQTKIPRAQLMFAEMFDQATQERQQGIANYMAELQDLYAKKAWFIRSILKTERE